MIMWRRLFTRAFTPTIHVDRVSWFYLAPHKTTTTRLPNGKVEIHITLRGEYEFEYNHERCWTRYKLCCTVDGKDNVSAFDDEMVTALLMHMADRYNSAHAD